MSYQRVAILGTVLFAMLFAGLVIAPILVIGPWGVAVTPEAAFMGRRLAAAFLGFAVLCFLSRNLPAGAARRAISFGIATALLCVAGFGVWEMLRGFASPGILMGIAVELGFAFGFLQAGRKLTD